MSLGDFDYQETTSHFLVRLLKSLRQDTLIRDAYENQVDDVEEFPISRQVESIIGTKDSLSSAISRQANITVTLPAEPSYKTKLWLWFREGWRLKDHSVMGNQAFFEQIPDSLAPYPAENYTTIKRRATDDRNQTEGRVYGIINGVSQYFRVKDAPTNRITDILVSDTTISFSVFFSPWAEYSFDANGYSTLFTKIDDDQLTHAIRVEINPQGSVRWRLIYKSASYELSTPAATTSTYDLAEFMETEFKEEEFKTVGTEKVWQHEADAIPPDWTWLFFTFDKTSRQLSIYKVADGGYTATLIAQSTNESSITTTFSAHLPMNEGAAVGDLTRAYDIVNDNDAVFATAPNAPAWDNGALRFSSDTQRALIANHSSIDALSVFTIAFKIKITQYAQTSVADHILLKGFSGNGTGTQVPGCFKVFLGGTSAPTLIGFSGQNNAGTTRSYNIASGAIPALNTWYSVVITYDGTNYRIEVLGVASFTSPSVPGDVFTNSDSLYIGSTNHGFQGYIADLIIDKGTAWGTTQKNWFAARSPGFKAGFPAWKPPKPEEPEEPQPTVRPMTKAYELVLPDTAPTQKINNPSAATPFVSEYNVPGGTPATVPEEEKYSVADGTTGGGSTAPYSTVYSLAPQSSTGNLTSSEVAYGQQIQNGNSSFEGVKPTRITLYLKRGSASGGTVYLAIIKENGDYIPFGAGVSPSDIPTDWTQYQRTGNNTGTQYTTVVGDAVGVVWTGSGRSGTLNIQRGGQNNHSSGEDGVDSQQGVFDGSDWNNHDQYSMAGVIETGGETSSGSNPWFKLGSDARRVAIYQLNSVIENIKPSKVIWRVRRLGSAASATVVCTIRNSSDTEIYRFPQTISFNSISTSVQDLQFDFVDQAVQWADGYRVCLEYGVITGIGTTTNCLEVNFNVGPGNAGMVGGNSIKAQWYDYEALFPSWSEWRDISPVGTDWAGKVYIGGASFTAYRALDNTTKRVTEKIHQATSPNISKLFGKKLAKANVILKKENNPTGPIRVKIWDNSGTAERAIFVTEIDASALATTDATYTFLYTTNNYVTVLNDRIGVEYLNGDATNKVLVKTNQDAVAGAAADGTKSILSVWNGTAWVDANTEDMAGEIFTGGVPDLISRSKVAIRCDSEFSRIYQDKITKVQIPLKKLGAPTGTYYIRSVRGSDLSNRDLLGSGLAQDLLTTSWTMIDVENFEALHYQGVSDKIVIEFEGGDINNCILVKYQDDDPNTPEIEDYDEEDTKYEDFDGLAWRKEYPHRDIAATLWTGGDTYIPDAGTPWEEPPDYYDHDLLIGGGAYIKDSFDSFYGMRIRDFRIFSESLTLEEMDTIYDNKYSKRGADGSLALAGYCCATDQTEPPE